MPDSLTIIYGCIAIELFFIGSFLFIRQPSLAVVGIFGSFLFDAITVTPWALRLGLNIYAADAVFVPLAVAALMRLVALHRHHILHLIIGALWLLFAFSFVRGVETWGLNLAGVEARGTFYFFTAVLYLSTVPPTRRFVDRVMNTWLLVASMVAGLALFRWMAQLAGWGIASLWKDDFFAQETVKGLRVLDAPQTFVLAIAMFICLMKIFTGQATRWQRWFVYVLALEVLLLQHRTVWVVSIAGLAWLLIADARIRGKLAVSLVAAAMIASVLYLVVLGSQANPIASSLQTSATSEETFQWRLEGWKQLLLDAGRYSTFDRLFGQPFGAGYPRVIEDVLVNRSPHNFYVQTFVRLGAFGLIFLMALYVISIRGIATQRLADHQGMWVHSQFWQMLLFMHLFYFMTYAPIYEQGLIIGIITGLVIVGTVKDGGRTELEERRQAWPVTTLRHS